MFVHRQTIWAHVAHVGMLPGNLLCTLNVLRWVQFKQLLRCDLLKIDISVKYNIIRVKQTFSLHTLMPYFRLFSFLSRNICTSSDNDITCKKSFLKPSFSWFNPALVQSPKCRNASNGDGTASLVYCTYSTYQRKLVSLRFRTIRCLQCVNVGSVITYKHGRQQEGDKGDMSPHFQKWR